MDAPSNAMATESFTMQFEIGEEESSSVPQDIAPCEELAGPFRLLSGSSFGSEQSPTKHARLLRDSPEHGSIGGRLQRRMMQICPLPFVTFVCLCIISSVLVGVFVQPQFFVAGTSSNATCSPEELGKNDTEEIACKINVKNQDAKTPCYVSPTIGLTPVCNLKKYDQQLNVPAWQSFFVMNVVVMAIVASVMEGPVVLLMLMSSTSFVLVGICTEAEIFEGFGSNSMVALALLFIISKAVERSGLFDVIILWTLGSADSVNMALLRLMPATALLAAVINNTPLVTMMLPVILAWSKQRNVDAMMICLPIAYVSGLGGMISKIGSSTNLVAGSYQFDPRLDFYLGFFDLAPTAFVLIVVVIVYVFIFWPCLLRASVAPQSFEAVVAQEQNLYRSMFVVMEDCELLGKSWQSRGLARIPKTTLINGPSMDCKASPDENCQFLPGHTIVVSTDAEGVAVLRRIYGLVIGGDAGQALRKTGVYKLRQRRLFEALLVTQSVPDLSQWLLTSYNSALIACRGEGLARTANKAGNQIMLVDAPDSFEVTGLKDFALVRQVKDSVPLRAGRSADAWRAWVSVSLMAIVILLQAIGLKRGNGQPLVPLATACLWSVAILICFDVMTPEEAVNSINGNAWLALCSAFGIGKGIQNSGVADALANGLVVAANAANLGSVGILTGLFIVASLLSNLMSNTATTLMMLPIAERLALANGIPIKTLVFCILYGANCVFATPIGTSTNMVVQAPAGQGSRSYSFGDYIRFGLPLQFVTLAVAVPTVIVLYGVTCVSSSPC